MDRSFLKCLSGHLPFFRITCCCGRCPGQEMPSVIDIIQYVLCVRCLCLPLFTLPKGMPMPAAAGTRASKRKILSAWYYPWSRKMAAHITFLVFSTHLFPLLCSTIPLNSVLKHGFVSSKYFSISLRESHRVIVTGDCKLTVKIWASWALSISFSMEQILKAFLPVPVSPITGIYLSQIC